MKYVTKPFEIDAIKANAEIKPEWFTEKLKSGDINLGLDSMYCKTTNGTIPINPDDYIILNHVGEIYPCPSQIFESMYIEKPEIKKLKELIEDLHTAVDELLAFLE